MENRKEKNQSITVRLAADKSSEKEEADKLIYLNPGSQNPEKEPEKNYFYRQSITKELIEKLQLARRTNECLLIIMQAEASLHAIQQYIHDLKANEENLAQAYSVSGEKIQQIIEETLYKGTNLLGNKIMLREQLGTIKTPKIFKIDLKELYLDLELLGITKIFPSSKKRLNLNLDNGLSQINIRRSYLSAQYQQLETHLNNIFPNINEQTILNSIADVHQLSLITKMNNQRQQTRKAQVGTFNRKIAALLG